MEPKMYVLTRLDLDPRYRIVQGSHALALFSLRNPKLFQKWNNETIIYLGVRFSSGIREWAEKLEDRGLYYTVFQEPDQEFQYTALACYDTGGIFKGLPLA